MRLSRVVAVLGAFALATLSISGSASAAGNAGAGLWPVGFQAGETSTDCGSFALDSNTFCYDAGDGRAVELGVKFTTVKPIVISGVRVYRVDNSSQETGSLWSSDGTLLATGQFGSSTDHGWSDLAFSQPVAISPGQTYIASYYTQNAYAFEYQYFTNSAHTVGPITALQSTQADPNGVYCYVGESCNMFPTNTYRDLNYWVSPLWAYSFTGFFQPVDNGLWNVAKAGSAIPVKFSLGGNLGLDILKAGYPTATFVPCPGASAATDAIEQTVTAGSSSLTYDTTAGQYVYVWKTNKAWAGKCVSFELGLNDDTSHSFLVQFPK